MAVGVNCQDHTIDEQGRNECHGGIHRGPSRGTCKHCRARRPIIADAPALLTVAGRPPGAVRWTPEQLATLHRIWAAIHDPDARDPDPTRERARLLRLVGQVPGNGCACRSKGRAWVDSLADATLADPDAHARAAWAFHDSINAELGKPRPTFDEVAAGVPTP